MENIGGYRGAGLELLSRLKLSVGDMVTIETKDGSISGVIMPRYESASDGYISAKLKSGYNTGIEIGKINSVSRSTANPPAASTTSGATTASTVSSIKESKDLPRIALISTGGTIASKIDYRTGGVRAALTASELYSSVPELASIAWIDPEVLLSEYSENLKPSHWTAIAQKVAEKAASGNYRGIVISHGTDTMHYTAAALSFALRNLPVPVVLVGAQRSSDRPSSDAAINLLGAVSFASQSDVAGVFVAMHAGTSDDLVAIHVGTRVRKNHTSRRDAFESIDASPIALVRNGQIVEMQSIQFHLAKRADKSDLKMQAEFDSRVLLVKSYPGIDFKLLDYAIASGYRAVILEGTGLGHVSNDSFPFLRKAIQAGLMVCMTSQCIWGRVRMTVYDTGRDLLDIGILPLSDMISETAVVKAMWALATSGNDIDAAKMLMKANIANEVTDAIPISS
ncbi:MAG TPA: Glu-tRNA(Gln) amidotransferase subunit GatD [Nitrososphaera sp.]|nr:Glu-tRNA(Gln) amidotransferase subunit GatD [Nitrososphaera sp.]